jgi:hypothetical protein
MRGNVVFSEKSIKQACRNAGSLRSRTISRMFCGRVGVLGEEIFGFCFVSYCIINSLPINFGAILQV